MNPWFFLILYVLIVALIALMPIYYELSHWVAIALAIGVTVIEQGIDRFRLYLTLIFAKPALSLVVPSIVALLGIGLLLRYGLPSRALDAIQFMLNGAVIGVILRQLVLSVILNSLFGRSAHIQRLFLLLGFAVVIWLFPASSYSLTFRAFFTLGIAVGLGGHILWRSLMHSRYRTARYARGLMEMLDSSKGKLTTDEEMAFKLFIRNRRSRFRQLLRAFERDDKFTPRLKILRAHARRVEGRYADALQMIDHELDITEREEAFDHLFLLQKALALSELSENTKMYQALDSAKLLQNDNFLVNATMALRKAEELPLDTIDLTEESRQPLRLFRDAMLKNSEEASLEVLSDMLGGSIPTRWGFVQDVYGYILLKAGDFTFSKDLFINCIEKEPSFSSSYLHLGEWNVAWSFKDPKNANKYLKLAHDCFVIAKKLERSDESRISRRADLFIKTYCRAPTVAAEST